MHNAVTRLQNVFGFFTTVATVVAAAIAVLSLVTTRPPQLANGAIQLKNVQVTKGKPHYYSRQKEEFAHIVFDLDVDLSELFTWNTKQVFLYVTATHPPTNSPSKTRPPVPDTTSIIWDAILPHPLAPAHPNVYTYPSQRSSSTSKSGKAKDDSRAAKESEIVPGLLRLPSQRPKYQLTSPTLRIASRQNATLALNYNIQPWVGALTWASGTLEGSSADDWLSNQWFSTWRSILGSGARTSTFDFPSLKNETAAREALGKEGLGTVKGKEANRGSPA